MRIGPGLLASSLNQPLGDGWPYPETDAAFVRHSPLGPWVVDLLGISVTGPQVILHALVAIAGVLVAGLWVGHHFLDTARRMRALRLLALAPVLGVMFTFLGNYDPWTVLVLAFSLWAWSSRNPVWLLGAGVLLGIQHFEQGVVALASWALVALAVGGLLPKAHLLFWIAGGALVGKAVLALLLAMMSVDPRDGRTSVVGPLLRDAVVGAVNFGPAFLASLFAGLWAVVVAVLVSERNLRSQALIASGLAVIALGASVTLDHTRVFAVTSVPVLAVLLVIFLDRYGSASSPLVVTVEAMAWVITPIQVFSSGPATRILDLAALDRLIVLGLQMREYSGSW